MKLAISKPAKTLIGMAKLELSKVSEKRYLHIFSAFNLVKVILSLLYLLELIGSIALLFFGTDWLIREDRYYGQESKGMNFWGLFTSVGLVYNLVFSLVGLMGVIAHSKVIMFVWSVLGTATMIAHGVLYTWFSSNLVAITMVLSAVYGVMIHKKNKLSYQDSEALIQTDHRFNPIMMTLLQILRIFNPVITLALALTAFYMTYYFTTFTSFKYTLSCETNSSTGQNIINNRIQPQPGPLLDNHTEQDILFPIKYPFNFEGQSITVQESCIYGSDVRKYHYSELDLSRKANVYVGNCMVSSFYSVLSLMLYTIGFRIYSTTPFARIFCVSLSGILTLVWLFATSVWTVGLLELMHFTRSQHIARLFRFCGKANGLCVYKSGYTTDTHPAGFEDLILALMFGYLNLLLWAISVWIIIADIKFYRKQMVDLNVSSQNEKNGDQFIDIINGKPITD